jgi:hypothetical protein
MRTIIEKCEEVKRYIFKYCNRINDYTLLKLQDLIVEIKEIIDDEINKRVKNLNNQGGL